MLDHVKMAVSAIHMYILIVGQMLMGMSTKIYKTR